MLVLYVVLFCVDLFVLLKILRPLERLVAYLREQGVSWDFGGNIKLHRGPRIRVVSEVCALWRCELLQ